MSEYGPNPEAAKEGLYNELNFETEELLAIKAEAATLYQQGETEAGYQKYLEYRTAAEAAVDQLEGDIPKIGLLVQVALFFKEVGDIARFEEELEGAIEYATNIGREDIAELLSNLG